MPGPGVVSMVDMRVVFLGSVAMAVVACAASNASGPEKVAVPDAPLPVEITKVEAALEIPEPPPLPVPPRPDEEPEVLPLSGAWAATFGHTLKFAEAMDKARFSRRVFEVSKKAIVVVDGGLPSALEFQQANGTMDLLNRNLAAAYFATDATNEQRIRVLEEASSTLLAWAKRLDELGLGLAPAAFKSDHRLALTFEDVAEGPAKRWRNEGYQLSKLCVDRGATDHIDNDATKTCKQLHDQYRAVLNRHAPPPKSTAPAECACNPGDPLCSATMSGWCRPAK